MVEDRVIRGYIFLAPSVASHRGYKSLSRRVNGYKTQQITLEGVSLSEMPMVRTTDGHLMRWNREAVVKQLLRETKLSEQFYRIPGISEEEAAEIAREVERRIRWMDVKFLSGPLVREIVNVILLERHHLEWRNICTRVGTPVYDAHLIDVGSGFEAHENANLQENAETSHKKKADKISKEQYLLLIPPYLSDHHLAGDLHIHDLEYFGTRPFCQDWDLRYFFYYGLMPDGSGTKASVAGPAKKPEVAMLHAVKALASAQTNFAGGQGFYNFLTFLAPYLEGLDYEEICQLMQMFVYEMTQMMVARGGQVVFSSVQLSPGVPKLWRDKPVVYKGKVWDGDGAPLRTYGEFEKEVRLGFKALMEVMLEGDYWGKPFNFPKPEISIEPDFMEEDDEFNAAHPDVPTYRDLYLLTFHLASKFGTPYYDNQLPAYRGAGKGISCYQCCAYQFAATFESDAAFEDKLYFRDGMHFSMGSWQVVSLNCPRAAYLARGDDDLLFEYLRGLMDTAVEIFKVKRDWMNQVIKNRRMPFATQRPKDPRTGKKGTVAVDLESLVYTIGVVGVNEMVQFHTGSQMHESKEAWKLAVRAMTEMEIYAKELSRRHGMTIALARTPAETVVQRFAVSDLLSEEFRDCATRVVKGDIDAAMKRVHTTRDLPVYYTNGTHVPPSLDVSIFERAKLEHIFFPIVDGGNIFHIFLGESAPDPEGLMDFAMNLARSTQIGYFAFTRDMTVCLSCFCVSPGLKDSCPRCGSDHLEYLSRVTGYLQSVSGWNEAKKQELKDRNRYSDLS
ncbi:MAG: anaerobic ribonucleoside triphosphate reductase [Methanosaeta sp. PtaB.Bin087]|jgi:ribonucleoside-triphosphate reductase|nr:anaerobic ribonucleoside-triphosphate reductase [Methanothrix sp.]OPX82409.1 MAG: anaerobic ribonucleoside triphosphate reductase [Methanosaeta sp. PtaB.Bin087]